VATVTDYEVAEWRPLIDKRATHYAGIGETEFDDLVQEAWLKVWLLLEEGIYPTQEIIDHAMIDYIRYWSRHGRTNRQDDEEFLYIEQESFDFMGDERSYHQWEREVGFDPYTGIDV